MVLLALALATLPANACKEANAEVRGLEGKVVAAGDTLHTTVNFHVQGSADSVIATYNQVRSITQRHKLSGLTTQDTATQVPNPALAPGDTTSVVVTLVAWKGVVQSAAATRAFPFTRGPAIVIDSGKVVGLLLFPDSSIGNLATGGTLQFCGFLTLANGDNYPVQASLDSTGKLLKACQPYLPHVPRFHLTGPGRVRADTFAIVLQFGDPMISVDRHTNGYSLLVKGSSGGQPRDIMFGFGLTYAKPPAGVAYALLIGTPCNINPNLTFC